MSSPIGGEKERVALWRIADTLDHLRTLSRRELTTRVREDRRKLLLMALKEIVKLLDAA